MAEYQVATSGTSADQETCPAHGLFAIGYCFDCRSTPVCGHDWGQLCNSCADVRKEKAAAKKQADEKARQEETQRQHAEAILATRQNHDELIKQAVANSKRRADLRTQYGYNIQTRLKRLAGNFWPRWYRQWLRIHPLVRPG